MSILDIHLPDQTQKSIDHMRNELSIMVANCVADIYTNKKNSTESRHLYTIYITHKPPTHMRTYVIGTIDYDKTPFDICADLEQLVLDFIDRNSQETNLFDIIKNYNLTYI